LWTEVLMDTTYGDGLADAPDTVCSDEPAILEEIEVEDLAVDGICGVY
jgi:mycofactocin precursor